jgi:hypothetical protein
LNFFLQENVKVQKMEYFFGSQFIEDLDNVLEQLTKSAGSGDAL